MSDAIKMSKNFSGLTMFTRELERNQAKYYKLLGELVQTEFLKETIKRAPKSSGDYAKSWRKGKIRVEGSKILITIETPMGELYIILEEEGSDPHTIDSPVNIKGVGWRYIKEHPGFPPIPHVQPSIRHVMDTLFAKLNDKALRESFPNIFG